MELKFGELFSFSSVVNNPVQQSSCLNIAGMLPV